jgi:thioredoxin
MLNTLLSLSLLLGGLATSIPVDAKSAEIPATSTQSFKKDVLEASHPVLVDFYATWCGPCKAMAPVVNRIASHYEGKIHAYRVDVDANPELAAAYKIQAVPTIYVFSKGVPVRASLGVVNASELSNNVNEVLNSSKANNQTAEKPNTNL